MVVRSNMERLACRVPRRACGNGRCGMVQSGCSRRVSSSSSLQHVLTDPFCRIGNGENQPRTLLHTCRSRLLPAAFEYDFGALDRTDNPLTRTYLDLLYVALDTPRPIASTPLFLMSGLTNCNTTGALPSAQGLLQGTYSSAMRRDTFRAVL